MENFKKFIYGCILLVWLVSGLYFGVGGYTKLKIEESTLSAQQEDDPESSAQSSDGVTFASPDFEKVYRQEIKAVSIFPFIDEVPDEMALLITACAFGILGAFTRIMKLLALKEEPLLKCRVISIPMLGSMTGFIMLGLASAIPYLLISGEGNINPISLVFLCFFAELYSQRFFNWLSKNIGKLYGESTENQPPESTVALENK